MCDQHKGGFEIPGHSRSKLFFKCTWLDFLDYEHTREYHNLGGRRKWDVRYNHFGDFSKAALEEDDWLYHRAEYDDSNQRNFVNERDPRRES